MHALILAGGKGTRLRPLTVYTPKPIVPVLNRPFLIYQLEMLAEAGISEVTLSLSYQPDKIEHLLGDGSDFGVKLRYTTEPSPLGTAGAYRFALSGSDETAVVLNGDILTNVRLSELIDAHKAAGAAATIATVEVEDASRYGIVETDTSGAVVSFLEKPADRSAGPAAINAGIYVLEPEILELIAADGASSFEYDVFPTVVQRGLKLIAHSIGSSYWRDIGTPENYLEAHHDLLSGKVNFPAAERSGLPSDVATRASVDKASVIAEGCTIKAGARIVNSVIGSGVYVDERAVVEDSVLWAHTRVSTAAEIRGSVIGRSCHIGRNATVSRGSVLGDKTTLTDYTRI